MLLYLIITHHSIQVLLSLSLNYYIFIYPRSMIYFCIHSIIHLLLLFEFSRYNITKTNSWIVVILMSNRWWMNLKKNGKARRKSFTRSKINVAFISRQWMIIPACKRPPGIRRRIIRGSTRRQCEKLRVSKSFDMRGEGRNACAVFLGIFKWGLPLWRG